MTDRPPTLNRKTSAPWDRLRPVKQDPLDSMGFVSKGDGRLLNFKTQETYYHKITARYMQFCSQHSKNLDEAFASLTLDGQSESSPSGVGGVSMRPTGLIEERPSTTATSVKHSGLSNSKFAPSQATPDPAEELATILSALRKLREGILATSTSASTPVFSQRVHVFNIRLAILALHPESYHASMRYLLTTLHSREYPLSVTESREMLSYLILDTALRLGDLIEAQTLRVKAKQSMGYHNRDVDLILKAVTLSDWPLFWKIRSRVDGYLRAIMHWKIESIRESAIKAIGKSYMKCDIIWISKFATGGEMSWEELVKKEHIGWLRDGNTAVIRKPKLKS